MSREDADSELDGVADELYGLLPADFTSTRDARAAVARGAGDRELATAIKALKRPTGSAWLVNLLVRRQPEQVEELLAVGAAMREAQEQLAGDELRRLSQQRRHVISSLAEAARALARDAGQTVSEEADRELATTLEAAVADPTAAEAVGGGRLTTALRATGLGSLDAAGAPPRPATPAGSVTRGLTTDNAGKREAAERARTEADTLAASAIAEAAELADRVDTARAEHRRLRKAVSDVEADLVRLQAEETAAGKELRDAERARATAERSLKAAGRRADHARRRALLHLPQS